MVQTVSFTQCSVSKTRINQIAFSGAPIAFFDIAFNVAKRDY